MRRALVLAVAVAAFAVGGHVDAKAKAGPSSVTVGINVKLAPNIKAKSSALAVSDDGTNLTFQIPLESLKEENGPPGRGGAMRKFLQVEQFPTSELVVPRGELKWQGGAATVQGTLKLHGKSKPIAISYEASRSGHEVKVRTKSAFKLTDFGFEPPALGPAKVSDDVELAVDATLNDE